MFAIKLRHLLVLLVVELHTVICKSDKMVNVLEKRKCISCGEHQPSFNYVGLKPEYCKSCKLDNMVDVCHDSERCECGSRASYNLPGLKPQFCSNCKTDDMVNVKHNLCYCGKIADFGYKNSRATTCRDHKTDDMIDLLGKYCITPMCDTYATQKKYLGYCSYCFTNLFPDSSIIRNFKIKERYYTDALQEKYPGLFKFDRTINGGFHSRRPDAFAILDDYNLNIEINEDQHRGYDTTCELAKLNDTFTDGKYKPLILLVINPDSYRDRNNIKISSSFGINKATGVLLLKDNFDLKSRLKNLFDRIDYWLAHRPSHGVTTEYLYYDGYS